MSTWLGMAGFLAVGAVAAALEYARGGMYGGGLPARSLDFSFTRRDAAALALVMYISAFLGFYRLGNGFAPETGVALEPGDEITLTFREPSEIDALCVFTGRTSESPAALYGSSEPSGENWFHASGEPLLCNVFGWGGAHIRRPLRRLRISAVHPVEIRELFLFDAGVNAVVPLVEPRYAALFDEREKFRLSGPQSAAYFDEAFYVPAALDVIRGEPISETTHPHLGKMIISLGIRLFGVNPFGWRFMSAVFGALVTGVMYLLARAMYGSVLTASATSLIFSLDFMRFVFSRIATIDIFAATFILLMYLFLFEFIRRDEAGRGEEIFLVLSGVAVGLAVATKWTGVFAALGVAVILLCRLIARLRERGSRGTARFITICLAAFIVVPAAFYVLSFAPDPRGPDGLLERAVFQSGEMLSFHGGASSGNPFYSYFWEWPLMLRPNSFTSERQLSLYSSVVCMGSPAVWWPGALCVIISMYLWLFRRDAAARFLCVAYLASYLPWFSIARTTFIYHYFPSSMFMILMIGGVIDRALRRGARWRAAVCGYLALVVFCFAVFYPVISGMPAAREWVAALELLPRWEFLPE